jgi:hypothetical protein
MTIIELYPDKFDVDPETGCWLFTGALGTKGYGNIKWRHYTVQVHRLSAYLSLGLNLLDSTVHALHKPECPNRNCANPDHLYLGSNSDNVRDAIAKGTYVNPNKDKEYCKHGHLLLGDNVYIPKDGRRRCQICRADARKRHQQQTDNNS